MLVAVGIPWTIRRYEVKYAALVILVVFCTYTGFGLFMGLLCPALIPLNLWMQRREIGRSEVMAGAVGMGLMCLSPLSFFWGFSFSDGVCPPHAFTSPASGSPVPCPNPLHYFLFVSFMFANFVGLKAQMNLAQTILAGSGILILVIAGFLVACRRIRLSAVPLLLISYSALFAVATAHGRMCLGLGAAIGSRYMVYLVPSLIGMYLIAVTSYDRVGRLSLLALVVSVAISSSFVIHAADREDMAALRKIRTDWKECYLTEHSLLGCNHKTGATIYSYPDTIQNKIDLLERKRLNVFSGDAAIRR